MSCISVSPRGWWGPILLPSVGEDNRCPTVLDVNEENTTCSRNLSDKWGSVAQSNQVSCKGLAGNLQQNQGLKKDVKYQ